VPKLKLSSDRKVSPLSRYQASQKRWMPKVANSFGLPAGRQGSCPDATDWCLSLCYADRLQSAWSSVDRLVWHNMNLLKECGSNVARMVALLTEMVGSVNWYGTEKVFRWHWDGDVFSASYARAIARTCDAFPDIRFWIYTRSFEYVPFLLNVPNLVVYLSVDRCNIDAAATLYNATRGRSKPLLRIAACADTWEETESLMRQVTGRNAPRCPELTGKTPLVNDKGQGACVACGLCIRGTNHVRFASDH
jgi:hypothetical protein